MAITVTTFQIASDFKSIDLVIDAGAGNLFTKLEMFVGSDYLTPTPVDLTSLLAGTQVETLSITNEDLGLGVEEEIIGLVTAYMEADDTSIKEQTIANLYYINLCLANMITNKEAEVSFDELNTIYLYLKAIPIYITSSKIEQALNAYEKAEAMCEKNPLYLVDDDIDPTTIGSGAWIINGTYIIN